MERTCKFTTTKGRCKMAQINIQDIISRELTTNQKAAWDKASALADEATKTSRATYEEVREACINAIKWQHEQDKSMLDAKDESIIQMEMSQFEIIQQVCKYREFLAGLFKCGEKRNFCCECYKKNCPMIK